MTPAGHTDDDTVYLDNQATTACDPRVLEVMLPWFARDYGNPHSSEHRLGQAAGRAVDAARAQVAALIGAGAAEIVFTSGATESNNIAIKGAARHARRTGSNAARVITLASEHKCVLESVADLAMEGFEPVVLPVQEDGRLDPDRLRDALRTPTLLVSVMAANNEIGTIQDIPAVAELAHAAGALVHTDAAQAVGKIPVATTGIDLLSLSGHKLYGPKGVGALFIRRRPRVRLAPLFSGGGQERGIRSGTLATPLIVGLGQACALAGAEMAAEATRLAHLRDTLLHQLQTALPAVRINGGMAHRLPGNLNLTFPGTTAAQLMAALPWLCVSTGSACVSADVAPSHVLRAIGLSADAASRSLRLGLGRFTSQAEINRAAAGLIGAHQDLALAATA